MKIFLKYRQIVIQNRYIFLTVFTVLHLSSNCQINTGIISGIGINELIKTTKKPTYRLGLYCDLPVYKVLSVSTSIDYHRINLPNDYLFMPHPMMVIDPETIYLRDVYNNIETNLNLRISSNYRSKTKFKVYLCVGYSLNYIIKQIELSTTANKDAKREIHYKNEEDYKIHYFNYGLEFLIELPKKTTLNIGTLLQRTNYKYDYIPDMFNEYNVFIKIGRLITFKKGENVDTSINLQ